MSEILLNLMIEANVRIGKRRTLVIPKKIAENLGIEEGMRVNLRVEGDKMIIEPIRDAIWLALHGKKVAKVTLKELEEESFERQKELAGTS